MNKLILLSFFMLAALAISPQITLAQNDFAIFRGKFRLLLIFAPSNADPRWQKQNSLWAQSATDFQERDILRLDFLENEGFGEQVIKIKGLRMRYGIKPGQFRVLLIGKDGHVASEEVAPVSLHALTEQIDRMPMRREEMKREEMRRRSGNG